GEGAPGGRGPRPPPRPPPPKNPAPPPQPNPLPHPTPMSVPAAFLIASGSANGKADATLEVTVMLAATTAIERQSVPLNIDISPFFFAYVSHDARKLRRHREYAARCRPTSQR